MKNTAQFAAPRGWRTLGTLPVAAASLVFVGGFITIGGKWFQMWRSTAWNGLDPAFRNSVLAGIGLVLLHLPNPAWGAAKAQEST